MIRPFLIAVQFLTRIPLHLNPPPRPGETGASLLFYPLVGLLIGALLVVTGMLLAGKGLLLAAVLVVGCWILITGGLHLDGLADTVDAWLGGMGVRERTLAIMQDPAAGPMGVLSLVMVVLLKLAAVHTLLGQGHYHYLLIPPILGRMAGLLLLASTPYVRAGGLAQKLEQERHNGRIFMVCLVTLLLLILLAPIASLCAAILAAGMLLLWRFLLLQRIGGYTGDTIGALIEATETGVIILLSLS
jgi:adenosylcobinamide-GDP ribazoletransferase